jgi:hypothetical protein
MLKHVFVSMSASEIANSLGFSPALLLGEAACEYGNLRETREDSLGLNPEKPAFCPLGDGVQAGFRLFGSLFASRTDKVNCC